MDAGGAAEHGRVGGLAGQWSVRDHQPKPKPVAVPEPVAEPKPKPVAVPEPVSEPVSEPVAEPVAERVAVAEPKPVFVAVAEFVGVGGVGGEWGV